MDLKEIHAGGNYDSDFEDDQEDNSKTKKDKDLLESNSQQAELRLPPKQDFVDERCREDWRNERFHFLALDVYARHKKLINDYFLYYPGATRQFQRDTSSDKRDIDIIRENHRFIWSEDDATDSWEKRLAKKYCDKLFKEYCVADLSRYKENKIGMRWRIEKEVVDGKGQFSCGNKVCGEKEDLRSWEVNFAYMEQGEKKNALVKLRLCPVCSKKLNFHHQRKEIKASKRRKGDEPPNKRRKHHSEEQQTKSSEENQPKSDESTSTSSGLSEEESKPGDSNIWANPKASSDEPSQEEEFDDYLNDLFL